jgi:hypothetical protein
MNRTSFLKGLLTGAIGIATIPAYSSIETKVDDVKKLTDKQLAELYESYTELKKIELEKLKERNEQTQLNIQRNLYEVELQNGIIPHINYINKSFSYKKIKTTNKDIKFSLKKVELFIINATEYKEQHRKYKNYNMHEVSEPFESFSITDLYITAIKGNILIGNVSKAEEYYQPFILEREPEWLINQSKCYGTRYFADLLFSKDYIKESIEYYNNGPQENIKKWIIKLNEGVDVIEIKKEFYKRYNSKAYFGKMYDNLCKLKLAKPLPKWMLEC